MREIVTYQSVKENPKSARDSNVSIIKRDTNVSINKMHEILTYQSRKGIPKSARDTNVSINKRES